MYCAYACQKDQSEKAKQIYIKEPKHFYCELGAS